MRQVLINLLLNALQSLRPGDGSVSITIAQRNDEVELSVADNGVGMNAATLDRIFEPFYTERSGNHPGIGLGLSITHAIVAGHNGSITAQSDGVGRGSKFTVRLPAAGKGAAIASF
jgi:signal transduction histidine kinase